MLRKLMKYELLSTGRLFLISYIALIIMSIVLRLWLPIQTNAKAAEIIAVVSVILYSAIIIAVIALTFGGGHLPIRQKSAGWRGISDAHPAGPFVPADFQQTESSPSSGASAAPSWSVSRCFCWGLPV